MGSARRKQGVQIKQRGKTGQINQHFLQSTSALDTTKAPTGCSVEHSHHQTHCFLANDEMQTAVEPAKTTIVDWRKFSDGDKLCKQLKDIEKREHDDVVHDTWRDELKNALRSGAEDKVPYKWEKCQYNTAYAEFDAKYDNYIARANWNFDRSKAPVFSNSAHTYATKGDRTDNDAHVIEPRPMDPAKLDGTAYARSSPTFFKARLGSKDNKCLVGLLDNCASLSLIDRKLLAELPDVQIRKEHVKIQGVGSDESKEFCILPFYIDCVKSKDGQKESARVKLWAEFHILDNLCESFVVGMDVIAPYQIDIMTSRHEARIRAEGAHNVPFPIFFGKGMPRGIIHIAKKKCAR
jgi:hypothetical protein